jgi:hypothetical protein
MAPAPRADPPEGSPTGVAALSAFAGRAACITLADGSRWAGTPRTELLSDRSVSVYLAAGRAGEGVTLYIDQIAEIVPLPISAE